MLFELHACLELPKHALCKMSGDHKNFHQQKQAGLEYNSIQLWSQKQLVWQHCAQLLHE
jgi:hypothetical protein